MGINYNKIPASNKKWGGIMCLYLSLNERAVCYYYYKSEFNFYEEVSYVLCSKIESLKSTFTLPPESLDSKLLKNEYKK